MVRAANFTSDDFVDAAIELIAEGGASAATIAAIARKAGAPTGSVYHRFRSRVAVVVAAWLHVQGSLLASIEGALFAGDSAVVVQSLLSWIKAHPRDARFLLLNEPDSLFDDAPPAELQARVEALEGRLLSGFRAFMSARAEGAGEEQEIAWRFVLFDGPVALVRPYLLNHRPIPAFVEDMALRLDTTVPQELRTAS